MVLGRMFRFAGSFRRHDGRLRDRSEVGYATLVSAGIPRDPEIALRQNPPMNYWLAKSEPEAYSWTQLVKDGKAAWTGVRNFQARNNLRAMKKGDAVFFYHSVTGKEVVGIAKVVKEAYADTTAEEGDWSCVDLAPLKALAQTVTLEAVKKDKVLSESLLVKQSRISVIPLTEPQAKRFLELAQTKLG